MDNHRDRPEIISAFAGGYGRSQRFSETRGEDLTYVAVRLPWSENTVLRVSEPVVQIEATVRAILTPVIVVTALAFVVAATFSFGFSARFGERIARLRRFSERVARGDFTPDTAPLRMDELDQLLASPQPDSGGTAEHLPVPDRRKEPGSNHPLERGRGDSGHR